MTLILNEIHGMGSERAPLMIAAADRRVSNKDQSYHSTRLKLFPLPAFAGAISYFGLAAFPQGNSLVFLSDWLPAFIHRSGALNLAEFAASLKLELEAIVPKSVLRAQPSGFHICGFDGQGRPDFWFLSNIGAMQGFEYTDLRETYLEPASHFLGRDAGGFGLDLSTGRGPRGRVQFYRNGDFRVHAIASETLDVALHTLAQFPDFRLPRTPAEYGQCRLGSSLRWLRTSTRRGRANRSSRVQSTSLCFRHPGAQSNTALHPTAAGAIVSSRG